MDCSGNNIDEDGRMEDPITFAPLDPNRKIQVGRLCYAPESLAEWLLQHRDITDVYGTELTERQLLDLLHLLDGQEAEVYPSYGRLARLIARSLGITLTYMIYKYDTEHPETMTHYSTLRGARQQATLSTHMDRKLREIGVHAITDDARFIAPLHHFVTIIE